MTQEVDSLKAQVTQLQAYTQLNLDKLEMQINKEHGMPVITTMFEKSPYVDAPSDHDPVPFADIHGLSAKTVYFCSGWFSDKQNMAYNQSMEALLLNKTVDMTNSYIPLQHQYKNIRVDEHPEYLEDKEWAMATYQGDVIGVQTSDVCVATYLPEEEDLGCGVELAMAKQYGKYVLLVVPDEDFGKPINLMGWGIADNIIPMSELEEFDFNKPSFNFYNGAVY